MKKFILYLTFLLLVFTVFTYLLFYQQSFGNKILASPIPDFLNKNKNSQVSTIDLWFPFLSEVFSNSKNKPQVSAKAALVYDLSDNKILFDKNSKARLPMASLTKIMTAVVAIENKRSDDRYTVYKENLVGENVMGLTSGEVLSLENLLYGLILNSGNDAAEVLAANTLGRQEFVSAMNNKAKSLGLKNTNFTNPSGLEGEGNQYTTAYDLLVITRYALANYPLFVKVAATYEYHIPYTWDHKAFDLYNETNLITSYPGVKGVKDGYTPEAGLCLVTYLDYGGHKMIGIILGSENRRQEMKDLLDYSLRQQGINPPPHS